MTNPLMELIGSGEGDYNSYNGGTYKDANGKKRIVPANQIFDFAQMSIAEIQRHQSLPLGHHDRIFAVGKYQLITPTLNDGIRKLQIDPSEKFTPELQDRLFNEYLLPHKRPQIHAYLTGKPGATLHGAQKATCMEWASVEDPDTPGHVFTQYEKHGNRMHTTAAQVAAALKEMRAEYEAQINQGLSAEAAWRATANMGPGQFGHLAKVSAARHHAAADVLREGIRNSSVGELQTHLRNLGYADAHGHPLASDNHFGSATRFAVEHFQRDHGLADDGIAGPATRAALRQTMQTMESASLDTDTIRTLQAHLNTLRVTDMNQQAVAINGVYDLSTRTAVARFQSQHGAPVTGQADDATRALLQSHAFIAGLQQVPISHAPRLDSTSAMGEVVSANQHMTQPYALSIAEQEPLMTRSAAASTLTLQLGDTGPAVLALQHQLDQLGHTDDHGRPLQADQHFGPRTQQAVQAFQRHHGLVADGVAGPQTLHSLQQQGEQLRQPAPAAAAPTPPTDEAARAARQASIEQHIAHLQRMAAEEKEAAQRAADAHTAPAHDTALWTSQPLPPPRVPSTFADPDHPKHYRYQTLLEQVQEAPALQRYTADQHARIAAGLTFVSDQHRDFVIQDLRSIEVQGNTLIATDYLRIGQASEVLHGNLDVMLAKTPEETASVWREWALPRQSTLTTHATASADPQPVPPTDMRHPQEPHHAMFLEARRKLGATYAHHGMTRDPEQLDREAARVTMTLRERQMNEVPTLRLACEPDGRFSTQPGLRAVSDFNMVKFSGEDLQQAPAVEQSSQTLVQVEQRLHEQALAHQQQWAQQAGLGRTR